MRELFNEIRKSFALLLLDWATRLDPDLFVKMADPKRALEEAQAELANLRAKRQRQK